MTKWTHVVPFLPLVGCAWPTTVGLRNDALLPPAGKVEVVGIAGAGVPAEADEWTDVVPGAQVTVGVADRWAVSMAAASDKPAESLFTELEARWRVLGDSPDAVGLVLLGGVSRIVVWDADWQPFEGQFGLDLGAVAGRSFGVVRPYGGLKLNVVPLRDDVEPVHDAGFMTWLLPAAGITVRPALGEHLGLVIGAEAFAALYLDDTSYGPGYGVLGWVGVGPRLAP